MKITKAEWDEFWKPLADFYMDDHDVEPEDDGNLKPGEVLTLTCGVLCWQGKGEPKAVPGLISQSDAVNGADLVGTIRRWKKAQNTAVVSVEIPKDKTDLLAQWVKSQGGKVIK